MPDDIYKQLTFLQKQIDNLIKPEIPPLSAYGLPANGRLTLTSNTPITGNVTAATTIYFTPFGGNRVALYDTVANWYTFPFSEISVAVPSTVYRLFDIFVYDGGATLEAVNWNQSTAAITNATNAAPIVITSNGHGLSNADMVAIAGVGGNTAANGIWSINNVAANTFELEGSTGNGAYTAGGTWYKLNETRATNIILQNGRYVKSGETNKLYLGTGMTTGTSGQTEVTFTTPSNVLLWNYYNRILKPIIVSDTTSHTYTSATLRVYRNINANKIGYVSGVAEHGTPVNLMAEHNFDAGDGAVTTSLGVNRTGTAPTLSTQTADVSQSRHISDAGVSVPTVGYNFFQLLQTGAATSPDFLRGIARGGLFC